MLFWYLSGYISKNVKRPCSAFLIGEIHVVVLEMLWVELPSGKVKPGATRIALESFPA